MKHKTEKWYFETSGFNTLKSVFDFDIFLNTRDLNEKLGRELLVSPITLWEIMLTTDDFDSDFLVFCAQNVFHKDLLATPTELIIRFLNNAYPENKINYPIYTSLALGDLWSKMTNNNSINFAYNKAALKERTSLIRMISKHLSSILSDSDNLKSNEFLSSLAKVTNIHYECLRDDGFLPDITDFEEDILFKLVVIFVLVLFIFKLDFETKTIDEFWMKSGVDASNPTEMLIHFFEKYPLIFKRGPFLEMAVMAYNQVKLGKTNRGLILDCYHMIYAPYVDFIVTGDEGFANLKIIENRYQMKITNINELKFEMKPFIKRINE